MSGGIIIGEICPYCTKFRSPLDFVRQPGGVKICTGCEQRHIEALAALSSGTFTGACSECGKTSDQVNRRMAIHFENGKYRMMCLACDSTYSPKRKELYGNTEFGRSIGLS